ncbi:MAG: methyltransferase domain-containing protein [Candidatus Competibacter sp.]|nr:methyltransferase domain-containing protein [Candidatus Competibacter sp.]MDG4584723.1 methyltransferase domain-containing protein [Candidatus Competibacter sp.]
MLILNLGCGTKTSASPSVINIDWSIYLRLKRNRFWRAILPLFVRGGRLKLFKEMPNNIIVHNLAKGIPFESNSVDVVYHSHMLEHLDKSVVDRFLLEAKRVLKPGGIHRIVVPDLEYLCKQYFDHLNHCCTDNSEQARHDDYIAEIIEQCVRKESFGTSQQSPLRRFIENLILGDARKRGETHQWMYDHINLTHILLQTGYHDVTIHHYNTSNIPDWNSFSLDIDECGNQYKPGSLYIEAIK